MSHRGNIMKFETPVHKIGHVESDRNPIHSDLVENTL